MRYWEGPWNAVDHAIAENPERSCRWIAWALGMPLWVVEYRASLPIDF